MAWMLLSRAVISAEKLQAPGNNDDEYYKGRIKTAEFFTANFLPITLGKTNAIMETNGAAVEISDEGFGG
jgi:hypothetical protein